MLSPCKIKTGILAGSRRDLGRKPVGILARYWPPWFFFLAGISPGSRQDSRQETKFPAAKILLGSYRESRQDSCRGANSQWQKSWRDLAGNLAKIGDRKRNSLWDSLRESRRHFSHAATNFFWIEPNVYVLKIQTKVSYYFNKYVLKTSVTSTNGGNDLRWLKTISSTFQDVDFDGSLLPLCISSCYNHGIKKMPNHWWTRWYYFHGTIGYHSNTMTCWKHP